MDLGAPHVVVVARHAGQRERAAFWASSHATVRHGLATGRGDEVVLLLPGDDAGGLARRVARELSSSLHSAATAGASCVALQGAPQARDVAAAYQEARRCAEALIALGRTGDGASAAGLGFVGLLVGDGRDVRGFVDRTLGAVIEYDARRGTALTGTLAAYFGTGGSPSRTAETMHIHVNTVTQRLDRIGKLLGEGWLEPERALEIQLALRLHRLGHTDSPNTMGPDAI